MSHKCVKKRDALSNVTIDDGSLAAEVHYQILAYRSERAHC
jgi:hypothetical protein